MGDDVFGVIAYSPADSLAPDAAFLDSQGLKNNAGEPVNAENLNAHIQGLMTTEIEASIREIGAETMKADIAASGKEDNGWLDGDLRPAFLGGYNYTFDFDKYLAFLGAGAPSDTADSGESAASGTADAVIRLSEQCH